MKKDIDTIILTRQELQIMKVIWELGAVSVKEVYNVIIKRKPAAYTTILTIMGILEAKGALMHKKSGRAYIYRPVLTRQQATRNQVSDILDRFFDGNPQKLIEKVQEINIKALKPEDQVA
jgi:BlaI family transcriptional regulator, penicillinase repressor